MSFASADGRRFRFEAQGRDLDLAEANELELEVIVAVGDDCARAVEPCNRGRDGRSLTCERASPDAPLAEVEVATRGWIAPLPGVVSVGMLGWDPFAPWTAIAPYAPAAHLGQVRLYTLDLSWHFDRTATSPPTPAQWQQAESSVRAWAREVRDTAVVAGYQPTANLMGMPRWLSTRPADESLHPNGDWLLAWAFSPPASLYDWSDLVRRVVTVIASEGLHLPYQVWDEPNWMFYGTTEDYFDLYETTASAVRAADPLALVGGPGVSGFRTGKDGGWATPSAPSIGSPVFLPAWIAEMGRRGAPIDFVDWHFPTPDPHDGRIDLMANQARGWLANAGYDPGVVRLRIGEWLYENCGPEAADLPSAAEIVPMLSRLADAGFTWHTHTSFTDQSNWSDGCWTHVGLFSGVAQRPHFLVRAKLNVFRLVSWLGEEQLPVARRDPFVEAIATRSEDGYEILLANAASTAGAYRTTRRAAAELCASAEVSTASCDALAACWRAWLGGTVVEAPGTMPACVAAAVTPAELASITARANQLVAEAGARKAVDWSGTVRIAGLRPGTYDLERALVDHTHGNVCAYNKVTEPVPSGDVCGAGGAVDQAWGAVEAGAEDDARDVLSGRGYSSVEIATIESELVEPCRAASSTNAEFLACVDGGAPALAAELGRSAAAMTADLRAASVAYVASLNAGDLAAATTLNALPEVTSRLEAAGQVTVVGGRVDLPVTLAADGVELVRLRAR